MKKGLWYIFKCQNCGKVFQEKEKAQNMNLSDMETGIMKNVDLREYAQHIGVKTHIVSTHKCKAGIYGCAKLIGCQIWGNDSAPAEEVKKV